jgi:tRNA/tmRNA/rRNA uracil-C5-methylase (TrmA/RlmC/RlmD family)
VSDPPTPELVELEVGPVAHGGHCVARLEGRVVFVRHALPGEQVLARLTEAAPTARFWRADAVEVLRASPDRVPPPCPVARPGGCGGCDWQHATPVAQRRLKGQVVAEQLRRLAGIVLEPAPVAEAVPGDDEGLAWRTRMRLAVRADGRAGLRRHRSHDVVALEHCPLAHPALHLPDVLARRWPPRDEVLVTGGGAGGQPPTVALASSLDPVAGPGRRTEYAGGRPWRVSAAGFWQVHPGAAEVLVDAVRQVLAPRPGERLLDLYSGVGLFGGCLVGDLGPHGEVVAVEGDARAVRDARRALHDVPQVRLVACDVTSALASDVVPARADLVVLDPPRSGAGREVCAQVAARGPRAIAYVACDPAALARDVALLRGFGYGMTSLRVLDLFPMTHHVECVTGLHPLPDESADMVG